MASLRACQECSPAEALHTSQDGRSLDARRAKRARKSSVWFLASWNVRTLLDVDGPIETARQGGDNVVVADERKVDQVVDELVRYQIDVAALQETKWFGENMYKVGKSVVLTSGRPVPAFGMVRQRGEGVAIVLSNGAIDAWKAGGSQWKSWNSRIVTATLKIGVGRSDVLHVLSCYAPTFASSREDKDSFYDTLQQAILSIPSNECYVILGDFNARVGSRGSDDDRWWYERGPHGYGSLNEAGQELLSFLSINEATVCNTWFMKKDIHKRTWQHPRSKQWHCIDYAIMRKTHRRRCLDATVVRGAQCNTDHMMLRVRLQCGRKTFRRQCTRVPKFDVLPLKGSCVGDESRETVKGEYVKNVSATLKEKWKSDGSVEEKWNAMKETLCETASLFLGLEKRSHPDWYVESQSELKPLLQERNRLHERWLSTGCLRDKRKFIQARRAARRAMRSSKNKWYQMKVLEVERGRGHEKSVWKCIRDIQRSRRGLVPSRVKIVKDENGIVCSTPEEQQQRWRRHFTKILNVTSEFSLEELNKVRQRPLRPELDEPPSEEELESAIMRLKNGKSAGESGILPEMLKSVCYEGEFMELLLDLVKDVWTQGQVPMDWCDAVLVPIPKKGDLSFCDNWRGISLLDVVGKVVARVLQERLQKIAEEELPESQCGFRAGRGCMDMIFTVRQLIEKSWEHRGKVFFTFVDLKKAYDSVPREGMWIALRKLGVPEKTISLIRSFHQGMKAKIRLDDTLLEEIEVKNGLRQGCCMAPVLFNLYVCLVVEHWHTRVNDVDGVGIKLNYKYDQKLFRRYTRNADERTLTECQFADDAALLATTRPGAEKAMRDYQTTCSSFGLKVSTEKTKHMVTGREVVEEDKQPIAVNEGEVGSVSEFPYLGSVVAESGRMDADVDTRIAKASRAFGALRKVVFLDKDLSLSTKREIYRTCVLSVLLYGAECWVLLRKQKRKLNSFHHRCIRIVQGISNRQQWAEHISATELRRRWGDIETITDKIQKRRLEWLGHIARMDGRRIPKSVLFGWLPQPRPRCGPRRRWRDVIRADLKEIEVEERNWYDEATTSRSGWRSVCRQGIERNLEKRSYQRVAEHRLQLNQFECEVCHRSFRRDSDRKRHKCLDERSKPVHQQRGAIQCITCSRWFRSKGGLAVHKCIPTLGAI